MRLCFVTPRYGDAVIGGAESVARKWAEHLHRSGHSVDVLTTRASNNHTWINDLPAGTTSVGGLDVTRFPISTAPDRELVPKLFAGVAHLPENRQEDLLDNTGFSRPLLDEI